MKQRLANLAHRQRLLLEKISAQRSELAHRSSHFERPLTWLDAGLRAVHYLYRHPTVMSSGVTVLLSLRHRGLLGLAKTGWRLLCRYPSILSFAWQALSKPPRPVIQKCKTPPKKEG